MSLPESLERAASELAELADQIRPANGDPHRLIEELSAEQAATLLAWILTNEIDSATELVDAWGESDEGAAILLGLSDEAIAKAGRKLLRRARHRLRSQGIEVASAPTPAPSKRVIGSSDEGFEAAYLSAPDFRGARVGYLADRHPAGGARLFEIRFDEARGILEFKVYNAGRSKVRGFLRSLSSAQAHRLFDVSRSALCALVRRASRGQPADRPLPSGFVEWRGRLFPESLDAEKTPGEIARAELESAAPIDADGEALDTAIARIEGGEIGPWPPAAAWMREWMEKGRADVESLEGETRAAGIESWRASVVADLGATTDRDLVSRYLEEQAWVHWRSDAEEQARELIALARAVAADDAAHERVAKARVESLFAPFIGELRVVEEMALDDANAPPADAGAASD